MSDERQSSGIIDLAEQQLSTYRTKAKKLDELKAAVDLGLFASALAELSHLKDTDLYKGTPMKENMTSQITITTNHVCGRDSVCCFMCKLHQPSTLIHISSDG